MEVDTVFLQDGLPTVPSSARSVYLSTPGTRNERAVCCQLLHYV
jgi:hypothetical protein